MNIEIPWNTPGRSIDGRSDSVNVAPMQSPVTQDEIQRDSHITHADGSAARPALDVPILEDRPLTAEIVGHRVLPQSVQLTSTDTTKEIRAILLETFFRTSENVRRKCVELRQQAERFRRKAGPLVTFAREMLISPRTIGAVCPSSPDLALAMARELGNVDEGLVLELGAGTGSITHALLQQGISPERLVAVERSPALAAQLRKRFPGVRVIDGDAKRLDSLLGSRVGKVEAVVSGLPLRSLPRHVVKEISQQIRNALAEDGLFVQFTYDLRTPSLGWDETLKRVRTRVVWKNVPPARVDTFVRQTDTLSLPSER